MTFSSKVYEKGSWSLLAQFPYISLLNSYQKIMHNLTGSPGPIPSGIFMKIFKVKTPKENAPGALSAHSLTFLHEALISSQWKMLMDLPAPHPQGSSLNL